MDFVCEKARAKVNLTLAVQGRRADGYHVLDSLVTFAGSCDELLLEPGEALSLAVDGPTAATSGRVEDNLVLRAVHALMRRRPELTAGHFRLTKRLPVAAGLGGGSADAAAALRLVARFNQLPLTDPVVLESARETGADVTVCLQQRSCWMRGAGEELSPALALPPLPALLVNPGIATPTAGIFRALALPQGHVSPYDSALADMLASGRGDIIPILALGRNDLEAPAIATCPVVGLVLAALAEQPGCRLARMSGSGATVFGLFDSIQAARKARAALAYAHPDWWLEDTILAGQE